MSNERSSPAAAPPRRFVAHVLIYSLWALLIVGGLTLLLARSLIPLLGGVGALAVAGGVLIGASILYILAYRRAYVRTQVVIARPVDDVFQRIATDFFTTRAARLARLAAADTTVRVEQTSNGPVGVGTTGREITERGGQQSVWNFVISTYDPPRHFALVVIAPGPVTQLRMDYEFASVSAGTRLTLTYEYTLRGLWRLATPFYVRQVQGGVQDSTIQLKTFLEA